MFQFTDIPPNATVITSSKSSSSSSIFGPGSALSKSTIKIESEVQKKRDDVLIESSEFTQNGKKITKKREIVTRVFTVRQEITRGMFFALSGA